MKRVCNLIAVFLLVALTFLARCHNLRDVFIGGKIYFVDGDCYSRMTRVQIIASEPGTIVKHHQFENWPQGVNSHATAPLDYLILALARVLDWGLRLVDWKGGSVLREQTLDLAGALISPLLGIAGAIFLGAWCWALRLRFWGMSLLLYAISPILVHGTVLGRPDHQSLLIVTLMAALGSELALASRGGLGKPHGPLRFWNVLSGLSWGISLWVSLYEPLILLGAVAALWLLFDRRGLWVRERTLWCAAFGVVLAGAFLIEGWRIEAPEAVIRAYFPNWERTIGELSHLDLRSPLLYRWLGWMTFASPVLLILMRKKDCRAVPLLLLLLAVLGLTVWQARWGYFLAVIFVLAMPWQMPAFPRPWMAWMAFAAALWPVAQDWDGLLFPSESVQKKLALQRAENEGLRRLVLPMTGEGPFLAPWWLSPSIAYWTGDFGVAGSSHESLPGIVDTARFYLSEKPEEASAILRKRDVRWVVADDAARMIASSATVLGVPPPARPLALILAENSGEAPSFLRERSQPRGALPSFGALPGLTGENHPGANAPAWLTFYRLYTVDIAKLPR